ncbi:hypothetical protein ES705_00203 [subsurface metagenome]|jgi:uncharacterized membrane protein|nr:DUF4870 domain-containing protein [Clostridia bacterium]TET15165.1 MAG: DUF4870 domain-containing protein [Actinomycetota bacterium]
MAEEKKVEVHPDFNKKSSTGMEPKIAVLLAYLFSWLGGLIIWLIEKENKFVKWNALQALILGIIEAIIVILMIIFGWIPFIGWLFVVIGWLALVAILVAVIIAIVKAFSGETFRIPGISSLTDKYFKM